LSSREFTGSDDLLNHEWSGDSAEHNPERSDGRAEGRL